MRKRGAQQAHPDACAEGRDVSHSLATNAPPRCEDMPPSAGAVSQARPASAPQPGQGCGASHSAIGRHAVNGPQRSHA
jgi:hypothetical protein